MALSRAQLADPNCPVSDDDYEAIESAIMETARGRWFLFEYARRHRHADTMMVMSAINSLHDTLHGSLQASLQGNAQPALGAPRRGPYRVSTELNAALLTVPRAELRAVESAVAPPREPAAAQPAAAAAAAAPEAAAVRDIPTDADTFEFKV